MEDDLNLVPLNGKVPHLPKPGVVLIYVRIRQFNRLESRKYEQTSASLH